MTQRKASMRFEALKDLCSAILSQRDLLPVGEALQHLSMFQMEKPFWNRYQLPNTP